MPKDLVVVCYFSLLDMFKPYSVILERGKHLFCSMALNEISIALDSQRACNSLNEGLKRIRNKSEKGWYYYDVY